MCDDNELMEMVQDGDSCAYESLVLKHRMKAIEFANSFVLNYYTAEDIVQECFAKIYINRQSYKPTYTFKTYLFTVIRNRCIDSLRKTANFNEIAAEHDLNIASGETLEEMLVRQERQKTIFTILNSLQDDYKTALYLFAVDEMSYKEIARVMHKTIPQIKIIIYRARQKLKKLYEGADIYEG